MSRKSADETAQDMILSKALRAVRLHRRLRPSEVAAAMGLPIRTYEHFEAGSGRVSYERIASFAKATNSDPLAILASVPLRSPELAVRCADNKLMTIAMASLRDLELQLEDEVEMLEARTLIGAFDRLVRDLVTHVRNRDVFAETWLQEKAAHVDGALVPERLKPGKI